MDKLVSIIVPCYNQAKYLPDALQSVLDQTFPHWECIIVDDGSPDNTEEVAAEWCRKETRFKYLKKKNGGLSSARNYGIKSSSGIYILPLDADDKISNLYIEQAVKAMSGDNDVKLVYSEVDFFGDQIGKWSLPEFNLKTLAMKNIIFCSAFFRRQDFDLVGGYDESFKNGLEDWEFWISLLKGGGKVIKLTDVHFFYRKKAISMLENLTINADEQILIRKRVYQKHEVFYNELFGDPILAYKERNDLKVQLERVNGSLKNIQNSNTYKLTKKIATFGRWLNMKTKIILPL